jgi:uncharacterized Zn finger protein
MKATLQGEVQKVNLDVYEVRTAPLVVSRRSTSHDVRGVAMTSTTGTVCPHCGWPDGAEPFQVVSRHSTAGGSTVWTRCGCGSLQVRVVDVRGMRIVSRSRPADTRSDAPCR